LEEKEVMAEVGYFINGQSPYIRGDKETMQIVFRDNIELNTFLNDLGIQGGDTVKSINGTEYNIKNVYDLISASQSWKEGEPITMTILRDGEEMKLEGKVSTPKAKEMKVVEMQNADSEQVELRNAWLKG
ncbi:MAG: peptidase M61, partial [Christiangramia sp.]